VIRFIVLDYLEPAQNARILCALVDLGDGWAFLEDAIAPMSELGTFDRLFPEDVPGKLETRRLSLADSEPIAGTGDAYWDRATPQPSSY